MRYNLETNQGIADAKEFLNQMAREKVQVDIKRVPTNRSLSQNNYLYLLISAFGMHFGYDKLEAKEVYKDVNKDIYYYEKKGRTFKRSTADLTKEEMQKTIDRFMRKSAEQGCPLPLAENADWISQISNEAEKNKYI